MKDKYGVNLGSGDIVIVAAYINDNYIFERGVIDEIANVDGLEKAIVNTGELNYYIDNEIIFSDN